ncbi:MAG: alpha amylase C-terminal domain-containing protein, partial [Gemmatimonadetes bacterium]|nr:alpha amylase C-terminal domain-containing protein [Gemmatimonadota bacterium]
GFRIDAAKHIQQVELDEILRRVNTPLAAESRPLPYFYLEVIGGSGEALSPHDYFGEGYSSGGGTDITEFTFVGVDNKFRKLYGEHISQLNPNGPPGSQFSEVAWGIMPTDKAVVFLENHDTQHDCGISYRDGNIFRLANVWLLAQPYGYPSILSAYAFDCPTGNAMGPPSDADGWTTPVSCASSLETATIGQWVCEHRDPYIKNMVSFRHIVAGTDITHWWDNGGDAIAFSRGDKGFVAINDGTSPVDTTIATGMAPGTYVDLLTAATIDVDSTGAVHLNLLARSAIAIDTATRQ